MDEKTLIALAVISSLVTCGLLAPVWAILLGAYYIYKAFTMKPRQASIKVPEPKVILPSNEFASDWSFVIRERINEEEN